MGTLLLLHVAGGAVGIVSGFAALYALKGGSAHRWTGTAFVYAMVVMAGCGAVMATLKGQRLNLAMSLLALYLVVTALLALRRRNPGLLDAVAMLIALGVGAFEISLGLEALGSPTGTVEGLPAGPPFAFGALALLAALGDGRMLVRGLPGRRRVSRHLWRMCLVLFVASGSFFLGQADEIPEPLRIFPLLAVPALLPLAAMAYWLWRVRSGRPYRGRADAFPPLPAGSHPSTRYPHERRALPLP